jgi:hypothetical protein
MTRDLRRNSQNRYTAAVTIIESIDQMEIAGSRTPGTDGQATSQMRFRAGGKRCRRIDSVMALSESPEIP